MLTTVGSLETAIENQHYILFAMIIGEFNLAAFGIASIELRSNFDLLFYHTAPPRAYNIFSNTAFL